MQEVWEANKMEEEWGFLLIDASNAFNEVNRTAMLWTVRHEWPSGARFAFNCYKHWAILVIRDNDGTAIFLHSKEGVTQGDPLAMFGYGIGALPLIRQLKEEFRSVKQPWYADDAGAAGKFALIKAVFARLQEIGPRFGYYPEPTKSILVVREKNLDEAKKAFADFGFKIKTGNRYLGGFIGEKEAQDAWIQSETEGWAEAVEKVSLVAKNFPQSAYAALQKSLQQRWQFVQRVTKDIGGNFESIQDAIEATFLPALFDDVLEENDPRVKLAALPVKHAGLAIPNPVESAAANFAASSLCVSHLREAIVGETDFRSADHLATMREARQEIKTRNKTKYDSELDSIVSKMSVDTRRAILRGKDSGRWLSTMPSDVNGTVLSAQEFRDSLLLRYARQPGDLPSRCDGCNQKFSVAHAMQCKTGGLVIVRHDEIRDELCDIAMKAFTPSAVRDEPKIYPSRPAPEKKQHPATTCQAQCQQEPE
jgi:hypothetical protein